MYQLNVRSAEHVRRYSVRQTGGAGWEVKLEEDDALRRKDVYQDWHRVERALALIRREVSELTAEGWWEIPADPSADEPVA